MDNLHAVIKSASSKLPNPNTYNKDDATIEIEFNGLPYSVTYHRERITTENSVKYVWGFENENFVD